MTMDAFPEDWTTYSIGQIGEPLMCKRILKEQTEESGDVPFYKIGTFGRKADAYISRGLYEEFKSKYSYPKKGDILISAAGTIGRLVVFDGEDAYFQDSNIVWLGNDETIVLNLYLYWAFQNMKWQSEDGGIVSRLYNNNFKAMQLVVPPLPEQRRIAAALGDMDKLIDNLSKRIEKKKAIKQGAMQELLTGKKRLPGFEGEWLVKSIAKSATVKARIGWQGLTTQEYLADGSYRLVNGTNIENGAVNWGSCYYVAEDRYGQDKNIQLRQADVLVSKDGTIGKVAFVERLPLPATVNSGVFVVRSKDYDLSQEYLARVFLSKWFDDFIDKITAGSTIVHLYQKDITKFQFLIPPTLVEQRAIAKVLGDMDAEIARLEAKREKLIGIKKGMMSDLLTGKVRLKTEME
ncbi:MAG: restriction endonuclease subunit S [Kiritimatiellae bacterium]|nr:restriction endonuclease subunit S [Kiritimatiellia bacterium]